MLWRAGDCAALGPVPRQSGPAQFSRDILISAATARGLTGHFNLEALPPAPVRGAAHPLELFALLA
ncbi:MAG: hypothetical protein K9K66_19400 [Desulfarculaceae bacterium]|nr:hypothetical protein [Desulfarculaceae bacterium]MCF8074375.1 hypothetical protein [Desulfarculaceae bacterium]MCF8103822.1 hypothetical protein [Desulfarculaceae bacterium]MCF8118161.1 hypothetical protein [Desulfarculaceae bacterium]